MRFAAAAPVTPIVLVVDDESTLRELVRVSLGPEHAFLEAEDGEKAVRLARAEVPDLVVLDLMLPRRSGLDVLADIRADATLAGVRVLVVTAQPALLEEARARGADEALPKPFEPEALASAAAVVLRGHRARRRAA